MELSLRESLYFSRLFLKGFFGLHIYRISLFSYVVVGQETRRNSFARTRILFVRGRSQGIALENVQDSGYFASRCARTADMINRGRICDEYHEQVWISNAIINNSDSNAGNSDGAILNTRFEGSFSIGKGERTSVRPVQRHRDNKRKRKKRIWVLREGEKICGMTWVGFGNETWLAIEISRPSLNPNICLLMSLRFYSSSLAIRICPHWSVQ